MLKDKLAAAAAPATLADFLVGLPAGHHHAGHGPVEIVREDDHKGHHISIRTTYEVAVDGKPVQIPFALDNDGNLYCHSLPNYQFTSAIGMVKLLIDVFPKDFLAPGAEGSRTDEDGAGQHGGGHGGHGSPVHGGQGGN